MLSFISTVRLRRIAADELLAFDFAGVGTERVVAAERS
jgi:hypothetical protein